MTTTLSPFSLSREARKRLEDEGGPCFNNAWSHVVFIHYEVNAQALQREVPFELDLRDGSAYVSLVAFTLSGLRPYRPSPFWRVVLAPMRTLAFLNLRTYVRHGAEPGVYFLAEWVPQRLAVFCGRRTFGLPYRLGTIRYELRSTSFQGAVEEGRDGPRLEFLARGDLLAPAKACEPESLDAFLAERYTAFTKMGSRRRKFRIWHRSWPLVRVEVDVRRDDLLAATGPWFESARLTHAAYSPGLEQVWIGRPTRI